MMTRLPSRRSTYQSIERSRRVLARLTGVVREMSGTPLAGAEITLLPHDVTTFTGPDGSFVFLLPAGRVALQVAADGYASSSVEAMDLVPGGVLWRDVVLAAEPTVIRLPVAHRSVPRASMS